MSKMNIFRTIMIFILIIGVIINLLSNNYLDLAINVFLLLGISFSALSETDNSHHTFMPISILFFLAGFIGIVAKYFYF